MQESVLISTRLDKRSKQAVTGRKLAPSHLPTVKERSKKYRWYYDDHDDRENDVVDQVIRGVGTAPMMSLWILRCQNGRLERRKVLRASKVSVLDQKMCSRKVNRTLLVVCTSNTSWR